MKRPSAICLMAPLICVALAFAIYAKGLLPQQGRGNMSEYANNVPGASARRFQYFISESPWEYRPMIAQIQRDVMGHIGDVRHGAIHIDETGFPKQGEDSVGVKRQYCGRLGKVDNCQVAVCLGYTIETVPGIKIEEFNE